MSALIGFELEHGQEVEPPATEVCYVACWRVRLGREDYRINDEERRLWILNDEGLYSWARSEGVRI